MYSVFFGVAMENKSPDKLSVLDGIIEQIETKYEKVFYGPRLWPTVESYVPEDKSFKIVNDSLMKSRLFVLYYPEKVVSGALVELGMAVGMGIPALIYTENINNITYFMRAHDIVTDVDDIFSWVVKNMKWDR